jgi:hypothetical protein
MPPKATKVRKVKDTEMSGHSTAGAATPAHTSAQPPLPSPTPVTGSPFDPPAIPVKVYDFLELYKEQAPSAPSTAPSAPEVSVQYISHIL